MQVAPGRILLVDDEANIRKGLQAILEKDGHEVRTVATAQAALSLLADFEAETAVLDIRMPGMQGTELLGALKQRWPHLTVIMLTGHGSLDTAITAVKEGAFDYLLKPAHPDDLRQVVAQALIESRRQREQAALLSNLQSGLQRLQNLPATPAPGQPDAPAATRLQINDLVLDRATHELRRGDEPISLTPAEYDILLVLAEQGGAVVDYATLVRLSLGHQLETAEAKELIKRHIYSLRRKIEPQPQEPDILLNVRGVGYRLAGVSQ
jgi:DNA-binding response OmpR family regulator